ncbi:ATP-dependent DNA ligase [Galbibacter sp. BG1]|uniref:ATP-dependent DNA ligase n=1 Tax=Galbibacter sp. BG1 TaxID=1170699 RepID=UPI0015BF941B|nr:ATP-dependent DNA ligase [Galbibacter sp. BG1]QLE01033.1 ATP-dependent DNA ligase [Galbibacter sp. BG1]
MKEFATLIKKLDTTNKTNIKVDALADFFKIAEPKDKLWAIALLSHRRPKRPVNTTLLREWASEEASIPLWLFEESYHIVGDLAETIALVIPTAQSNNEKKLHEIIAEVIQLKDWDEVDKKKYLQQKWRELDYYERFVFNKILTGSFRIGISQKLMTRALAKATEIDEDVLAYKLMGNWTPQTITFQKLILEENEEDYLSKPYPFYLAYALEGEPSDLGDIKEWYFEHKWDGIRSQVIVRNNELFVWSRGEELVTDKYPEFQEFVTHFPDGTVIDGEILAFTEGFIGTFNELQTRIGRKNVSKKLLEKTPVILKAYDLLEWNGEDIRNKSFQERRKVLDNFYNSQKKNNLPFHLSEIMQFSTWDQAATEREQAREVKSEGLMLKRKDSPYLVGRKKGDWWKWKVDPLTIDAVLTYAMRGHGRRTNLFTDYTFALWDDKELVTFAKAYSGLTDAEFRKVDNFVKKNTTDRFGPVRQVVPELVFEIAFEGIAESKRHKSGVAVRFPRILRWRKDKKIEEANTLEDLKALLA